MNILIVWPGNAVFWLVGEGLQQSFKIIRGIMKHLIARVLHWFIVGSMILAGGYLAIMLTVFVVD
ncbi:hypothetical protein N9448_00205 [Litorivicinus sp.]|nr:hypothetical protein [Litorivicinus sp.]